LPQTLEALNPDVVLLELGAVDGLRGQSLAMIRKNLEQMITLIEASGARVLIGGIRIPANYGPRYTDSFRNMYKDIAAEHGLPFVQLYIESIGYNPDLMQRDGVHPREEAQPMVKDHIKEFLLGEGII
jgi:acyl-CoA thioesterase-1